MLHSRGFASTVSPLTNQRERGVGEDPPDFLTVEEAAEVLRIGRTAAYQLARRYIDTGGRDGMPACKVGRQTRVPRALLEEMLCGPITWPLTSAVPVVLEPAHRPPRPQRSRRTARPEQSALPFGS